MCVYVCVCVCAYPEKIQDVIIPEFFRAFQYFRQCLVEGKMINKYWIGKIQK